MIVPFNFLHMTPKYLDSTVARAHTEAETLLVLYAKERNNILVQFSRALRTHHATILRANARDCNEAQKK